jgi:uncharacterized membrane protein
VHVESTIEINRPLRDVFGYVSDVGNYPLWMAHVLDVHKDVSGPPQHGDRFTVAIRSVGRRFETPYERVSYEPNRRCTDRAVGGPVPNQQWDSSFHEVPGGTRVTRTADAEMSGVLQLLNPVQKWSARRQLGKDLQALKAVLEGWATTR